MSRLFFAMLTGVLLASPLQAQPPQPASLAPRETGNGVLFRCYAPEARRVFLAGSFNRWAGNVEGRIQDPRYAMRGPDKEGVHQLTVNLPAGVYAYKFAMEDHASAFTWFAPEYAIHRDDEGNALVIIDGTLDHEQDLVVARPPQAGPEGVTFELFAPEASIVFLAGDFNNWANRSAGRVHDLRYAMRGPDAHGVWRITAALAPGRYRYQFVVDGLTWIADPLAAETAPDGTSTLEVRP